MIRPLLTCSQIFYCSEIQSQPYPGHFLFERPSLKFVANKIFVIPMVHSVWFIRYHF